MKEFIDTFGDITIAQIVIIMVALGWVGGLLGQWLAKAYQKVTRYHDEREEYREHVVRDKETVRKVDLLVCANLAMLSHHLFTECERLLERGWVTIVDLENIKRLYKPYHKVQ